MCWVLVCSRVHILNEINAPYTSLLFLDYNPTRILNKPFVILRLKIKTYFSNRKCCFLFIKVILYAQFWVDFSNYANRYSRSGAFLSMNIITNFMHFNEKFIKIRNITRCIVDNCINGYIFQNILFWFFCCEASKNFKIHTSIHWFITFKQVVMYTFLPFFLW